MDHAEGLLATRRTAGRWEVFSPYLLLGATAPALAGVSCFAALILWRQRREGGP